MNITFTITQIELSWILFALLALVTVPENHNRLVTEVYLQGNCDLGQPPQGWMEGWFFGAVHCSRDLLGISKIPCPPGW